MPELSEDRYQACLVTGASSGIGAEIARVLAERGRTLVLAARREAPLFALAEELAARFSVRAEVVVADVSDGDSRTRLLAEVAGLGLSVEVLVNNAGFGTSGPVVSSSAEREVAMVQTNVEAVVDLCSRIVPEMVGNGHGAILNVASTAAYQPLPGQAAYAASKAFVLSYTDALAAELVGTGVSATSLCPGPVRTNFGEVAGLSEADLGGVPSFVWVDASSVARAAVSGMERGQRVVIPGMANRIGAVAGHLTPRDLLLPIVRRVHPSLRH